MNTIATIQKGIPTPTIFADIHRMAERAAGRAVAPEAIRLIETISYGGGPAFAVSYTLPGVRGIIVLRMPLILSPSEIVEISGYMEDLERRAACGSSSL